MMAMNQGKPETKSVEQKVLESQYFEVNPSAEGVVNVIALVNLIIGILGFVVLMIVALSEEEWSFFGIGVAVLVVGIVWWAFLKVLVNISRSLYNVTAALKELRK